MLIRVLLVYLTASISPAILQKSYNDLLVHLESSFSQYARPVRNVSDPVVVTLGFELVQLVKVKFILSCHSTLIRVYLIGLANKNMNNFCKKTLAKEKVGDTSPLQ